jgi:hypothetical protein
MPAKVMPIEFAGEAARPDDFGFFHVTAPTFQSELSIVLQIVPKLLEYQKILSPK